MTDRTLTQDLSYSYDAAGFLSPAANGTPLTTSDSFSDESVAQKDGQDSIQSELKVKKLAGNAIKWIIAGTIALFVATVVFATFTYSVPG